jgi:hypothetical protein
LQISTDGGDEWNDIESGAAPGDTNWNLYRINPKLFNNKEIRPALLQVKPSADAEYSSHRTDASNAVGAATLSSTIYTGLWASYTKGAVFALKMADAADTLSYLHYMRRMDPSERDTG